MSFTSRTLLLALSAIALTSSAFADSTLTPLYFFRGLDDSGQNPSGDVIQGTDGNFYGTTRFGGNGLGGTIFRVTPAGKWATLADCNSQSGSYPTAGLTQASDGNFYGTTIYGGPGGYGAVFKMTPAGVLTQVAPLNLKTGYADTSALLQAQDGNLYAATPGDPSASGGSDKYGAIFKVTLGGTLTTLLSFNGANGSSPHGKLLQTADGNFYGTTFSGGSTDLGTVFKVTPGGVLTTVYTFNGSDGANPHSGVILGTDGNFYGMTTYGGAQNLGTVFKLTPAGVLTTLVSFDTTNGARPYAGLIQASDGLFYGTTTYGGPENEGTVFKMTPAGNLTTLAIFFERNGRFPYGTVIEGKDGLLYGTTTFGGAPHGPGTFFKLTSSPEFIDGPAAGTALTGAAYSFAYNASGFPAPDYTLASGSLPPGLTLSPDGLLAGTPTKVGTFTGEVKIDNGFEPSATQVFSIKVGKGPQTIAFPAEANPPYGVPFYPKATASSGLPVRYTVLSGPATVSGNRLTFSGVGKIVLQGSQPGSSNFAAAPVVTTTFTVVKGSQTITPPKIPTQKVGGPGVVLSSSASSGLTVTYKVTGPATLSGNVLTTTGAGTVNVGCYQSGNALYQAAPSVVVRFKVSK